MDSWQQEFPRSVTSRLVMERSIWLSLKFMGVGSYVVEVRAELPKHMLPWSPSGKENYGIWYLIGNFQFFQDVLNVIQMAEEN